MAGREYTDVEDGVYALTYRFEKGHMRPDRGEFLDKGNYVFDPRHPDFGGGADVEGLKDSYHAFLNCDTESVADGAACVLGPGTYIINSDLTLSAHWWIEQGVTLKPASGVDIVFGGGVSAGPYDWIDESNGGRVIVANDGTPQAFRQWRGAASDSPACPFTWTGEDLPEVFWIKSDGTAYIDPDFDVADLAPEGDTAYYVDFVNGDDDNAGTEAEPLKTIPAAFAKSDVDIVYLEATAPHQRPSSFAPTRSVKIKPYNGTRAIISEHDVHTWSQTADTTNVYEAAEAETIVYVLDFSSLDANGDPEELTLADDVDDCDSTAGSYYTDGAKVYVHTSDAREPDADIYVLLAASAHSVSGDITVYMEDITIYGGSRGLLIGSGATFIAKNLIQKYSTSADGIEVSGATAAYFQDCTVARNVTDGISYRSGSTVPIGLEIGCTSRHNGLGDSGNTHNGSTGHGGVKIVRINGTYWMNKGPNVVDVGGSESWNVGCIAYDSAAGVGSTTGNRQRSNFFIQDGHMWVEGGESRIRPNGSVGSASAIDLVADGGYLHIRQLRQGHTTYAEAETPSVIGTF